MDSQALGYRLLQVIVQEMVGREFHRKIVSSSSKSSAVSFISRSPHLFIDALIVRDNFRVQIKQNHTRVP